MRAKRLVPSVAMALLLSGLLFVSQVYSQSATPITGWAWSDTIGWVCFGHATHCPTATLMLNTNNTITGYAWSEHIGWIQFGSLSGFPSGSGHGTQAVNAQKSGNSIVGWARALGNGGGWDGWIALSGTNWGVTYNPATGSIGGFAWGSDVVGWLEFDAVGEPEDVCTDIADDQTIPLPAGCTGPTPSPIGECLPAGYEWSGFACVAESTDPPSGCLSVGPAGSSPNCSPEVASVSVRRGATAVVYWSVADADECTSPNFTTADAVSGTAQTGAIQNQTTLTIQCTGEGGTFTDSATINIIPEFREI